MLKVKLGINNEALADKLGISAQTITNWLHHPPKNIKPETEELLLELERGVK